MGLFSKLRGTIEALFQVGLGGPQLKNNSPVIEARDSADAAFAIVRGADPVGASDLTTKAYVDGKAPFAAPVAVAAGSTQSPTRAASTVFVLDSTGALITINTPSSPLDGDVLIVIPSGATNPNPAAIVGTGGGVLVGDPNNPGSAAASVNLLAEPGGGYLWQYQAATTTWQQVSGIVPMIQHSLFTASGTFTAPLSTFYSFDGIGGAGAGGSGAPGIIGLGAQNGGGGGGASVPVHGAGFISQGTAVTVTIPAAATGVAGADGNPGGDVTVGNFFTAAGAAGGEFGGTPAAGTAAAGGMSIRTLGIGRIPPSNPTFKALAMGGWGGSTGGPTGTGGTQGRGATGFPNALSNFGALGIGGSGGVQGATNTNPGGCGGGGGAAGAGTPGVLSSHDGGAGRPGGAGSAAGTGGNGLNGLGGGANTGAGGGGGGAGGNGAVAGGTGGTGGNGGTGGVVISWVGFTGV